jgi:CheY-like chemotaxis protein
MSRIESKWTGDGGVDVCGRLRLSEATLEAPQAPDSVTSVRAEPRLLCVLVVDDDRDTANSLSMLAKLWGHDVHVAYSGAGAIEAAEAYQPDVVLLDVAMPLMDGNHLAQHLRRQTRFKETLLIAITGYGDEPHRLGSETAGFDHFLIKPVDPLILEKMLQLVQNRRSASLAAAPPTPRTNGLLIVDDDDGVRGVLNLEMRQQGFTVWLAAGGAEALDLYRQHSEVIDVVLMDVRMPRPDGPQTLVALRELNPHICCCFMSGDLGRYTETDLHELGAAAVLWKPFRSSEVGPLLWGLASHAKWNPSLLGTSIVK